MSRNEHNCHKQINLGQDNWQLQPASLPYFVCYPVKISQVAGFLYSTKKKCQKRKRRRRAADLPAQKELMFSRRADGEMSKRLMENFSVLGNKLSPSFLLLSNKCMWRNANEPVQHVLQGLKTDQLKTTIMRDWSCLLSIK